MDPIYVDMQQSAAEITALRRRLAAGGVIQGSTTVHLNFDDGSRYAYAGTVQVSEVTVDEGTGGLLTNSAEHDANLLGAEPELASWDITLPPAIRKIYMPIIGR